MVGVIILNYNNSLDLEKCINSLVSWEDMSKIKMMVVDNGSSLIEREKAKTYLNGKFHNFTTIVNNEKVVLGGVNYLQLEANLGYAQGNNAGMNCFMSDKDINYIMFLNSDIIFTRGIIAPLIAQIKCQRNCGAISPLLYNKNGEVDYCCARLNYDNIDLSLTFSYLMSSYYRKRVNRKKILLQHPELLKSEVVNIELPSGSCMLFDKSVLKEIGGFDPNTFLYYEESILYEKLKKIGRQSYLLPSVSCIHVGGATTTKTKTSYFLKLCNFNSLLYYVNKYRTLPRINKYYMIFTGKLILLRLYLPMKIKSKLKTLFYENSRSNSN